MLSSGAYFLSDAALLDWMLPPEYPTRPSAYHLRGQQLEHKRRSDTIQYFTTVNISGSKNHCTYLACLTPLTHIPPTRT